MLPRVLFRSLCRLPAAALLACLSWAPLPAAAAEVDLDVLHHFSPEPRRSGGGVRPRAGVVQAPDGVFYGTTSVGGKFDKGAIYRIDPEGKTRILHAFRGGDGAYPNTELVIGDDGVLYGSTEGTGSGGSKKRESVLFKYDQAAGFALLHTFNWDTEGGMPGSLLRASDGNFYGTLQKGAGNDSGALFRMTPGGEVTVLRQFRPTGLSEPTGILTQGLDGALYGTSRYYYPRDGSDTVRGGAIYRYGIKTGKLTVLHTFAEIGGAPDEGSGPDSGLVLGLDGMLYGMTSRDGANGTGTFFRIHPDGTGFTVLSSLPFQYLSFSTNQLVRGRDGNFYGSDVHAEWYGAGWLIRLTPEGVHTVLYEFPDGGGLIKGNAPNGRLLQDNEGRLVGTAQGGGDTGSGTLFRTSGAIDQGGR